VSEILFSIIIPTYNRHDELKRCLAAIAANLFGRSRFEVIVVNDGGSSVNDVIGDPGTAGISARQIFQPNRGPASARNLGAASAKGRYVAFIDDDCIPSADWLTQLEKAVWQFPRALIGGTTINVLRDNSCSQASQSLVDYVYWYYNDESQNRTRFFASNNLTVDAAMFTAIGGFDESFRTAEDRDFCRTWKAKGWEFQHVPEVIVHHCHYLTLRSLQRQHFRYGRGALPYWKKAAERTSTRIKIEPLGFYAGMLLHPFSQRVPKPAKVASLIFLSQIANAAGFAYEALRSMSRSRPITASEQAPARI